MKKFTELNWKFSWNSG